MSPILSVARLLVDGRHIAGLGHALSDARLAARIGAGGIKVNLYRGKSEGRVLDLAAQLAKSGADAYLFWVTEETWSATEQLVAQLDAMLPGSAFFYWNTAPASDNFHSKSNISSAVFLPNENLDATARSLLTYFGIAEAGIAPPPSPYLSGLLQPAELTRLGLSIDDGLALLDSEVTWLAAHDAGGSAPVRIDAASATAHQLASLCDKLRPFAGQRKFELHAQAASCSPALLPHLTGSAITSLLLEGDAGNLPPAFAHCGVPIQATPSAEQIDKKAATYGRNGSVVLHLGAYYDGKTFPAIYHLEVPLHLPPVARMAAYRWASPHMALRSAAVVTGSADQVSAALPALHSPAVAETAGWPKHSYALASADNGRSAQIVLDGRQTGQHTIAFLPFRQRDERIATSGTTVITTLNTEHDIVAFDRMLTNFQQTGALRLDHPAHALLVENACRWGGHGRCTQPLLRRLTIGDDGQVRSCRDAGEIGKVGDSFDGMVKQVRLQRQHTEVERACWRCPVRDDCSQCSALPALLEGRYCELRQAHPYMALYFDLLSFLQLAPQLLPAGMPSVDIRVCYAGLQRQYFQGPASEPRAGARPVIVQAGDTLIAWWRGTRKLSRLSPPLALMAEAWWEGASDNATIDALMTSFQVDRDTAQTNLALGRTKLRDSEVIA